MPDATAPPSRARALTVLFITTLAFAVCFAVPRIPPFWFCGCAFGCFFFEGSV